jgi:hypothetical protein
MVFTTFEYKVCTTCKCEVTDSLITDKERERELLKKSNNGDVNVTDEFDFWAVNNTIPTLILDADDIVADSFDYLGMD